MRPSLETSWPYCRRLSKKPLYPSKKPFQDGLLDPYTFTYICVYKAGTLRALPAEFPSCLATLEPTLQVPEPPIKGSGAFRTSELLLFRSQDGL